MTGEAHTSVSAVVFDLGNVLIDWQPLPAVAAAVGEEEARAFLAGFDFDTWNRAIDAGRSFAESEQEAVTRHPQWREHILGYRRNFARSLVRDLPETVDVLREVHAAGIPVFALTNWADETFHHAVERFEWLGLFEDVVVSGTEGVAKPDPRIFDVLAARTGRPLSDLFFVDDSPANVESASATGMIARVFTTADRLRRDLIEAGVRI